MSEIKNINKILTYLEKDNTRALFVYGKRGYGKSYIFKNFLENFNVFFKNVENIEDQDSLSGLSTEELDLIERYKEMTLKYTGFKSLNACDLNATSDIKNEFSNEFKKTNSNVVVSNFKEISSSFLDKIYDPENTEKYQIEDFLGKAEKMFSSLGFVKTGINKITSGLVKVHTGLTLDLDKDLLQPSMDLFKKQIVSSYYNNILENKILIIDEVDRLPEEKSNRSYDIRLIDIFNKIIDLQENNKNLKIIFIMSEENNPNKDLFEEWKEKIFSDEIEIKPNSLYNDDYNYLNSTLSLLRQSNHDLENRRIFEKYNEFNNFIDSQIKTSVYTKTQLEKLINLKDSILYDLFKHYDKNKKIKKETSDLHKINKYVEEFLGLNNIPLECEIKNIMDDYNYEVEDLIYQTNIYYDNIYHSNKNIKKSEIEDFIFNNIINKHKNIMPLFNKNSHDVLNEFTIIYYLEFFIDKGIINSNILLNFKLIIENKIKVIYEKCITNKERIEAISYLEVLQNIIIRLSKKQKIKIKKIKIIKEYKNKLLKEIRLDFINDNIFELNKSDIEFIFKNKENFLIELFKQLKNNNNYLILCLRDLMSFQEFSNSFEDFILKDRFKANYRTKDSIEEVRKYFKILSID
jgi:hypothetical protein